MRLAAFHPLGVCRGGRKGKTAHPALQRIRAMTLGCLKTYPVIPGREQSERTRNDEVSKNEMAGTLCPAILIADVAAVDLVQGRRDRRRFLRLLQGGDVVL